MKQRLDQCSSCRHDVGVVPSNVGNIIGKFPTALESLVPKSRVPWDYREPQTPVLPMCLAPGTKRSFFVFCFVFAGGCLGEVHSDGYAFIPAPAGLQIQNWLEKLVMMTMHYTTSRLKTLWTGVIKLLVFECFETKVMCTYFRKTHRCPKPVYIKGEAVERVDTYTYLGVGFDSKLNWKEKINSVLKMWTRECIAWESWDHLESIRTC